MHAAIKAADASRFSATLNGGSIASKSNANTKRKYRELKSHVCVSIKRKTMPVVPKYRPEALGRGRARRVPAKAGCYKPVKMRLSPPRPDTVEAKRFAWKKNWACRHHLNQHQQTFLDVVTIKPFMNPSVSACEPDTLVFLYMP